MTELIVTDHGPVRHITFSGVATRNAFSTETVQELDALVRESGDLRDISVLVLSGAGPGFSSGADMRQVRSADAARHDTGDFVRRAMSPTFELRETIRTSQLVVIAAVHGFAVGGGFALALACDLVVAADDASFWLPEVTDGLVPTGPTAELTGLLNRQLALDLLIGDRRLTAAEAQAMGLVTRVYPTAEFLDRAMEYAQNIGHRDRTTVGMTKQLLRRTTQPHRAEVLAAATDTYTISKLARIALP